MLTCPRNGASLSSQLPLHLSQVPTSQGPILAAAFSLSSLPHFSSNRNPLIYPVLPSWSVVDGSQHHCSLHPGAGPSYLIYRPSGVHIQLSGGSLCTHCYLTSTEFLPRQMIMDCIPGPKADNLQCKSAYVNHWVLIRFASLGDPSESILWWVPDVPCAFYVSVLVP